MYNNNIYLLLYKKVYNDNKHSLYMKVYIMSYMTMYNDNKYFLIYKSVFLIIQDDV